MRKGNNIQQLGELLNGKIKGAQKVQTHWCVVKEVDWEEKTMDAIGVSDDLEFYNVQLGLGSFYRKPKAGAMCLIGTIENKDAAAFLIECESVDEFIYKAENAEFNIKTNGFYLKKNEESLKKIIDDTHAKLAEMSGHIAQLAGALGLTPVQIAEQLMQTTVWQLEIPMRVNNLMTE